MQAMSRPPPRRSRHLQQPLQNSLRPDDLTPIVVLDPATPREQPLDIIRALHKGGGRVKTPFSGVGLESFFESPSRSSPVHLRKTLSFTLRSNKCGFRGGDYEPWRGSQACPAVCSRKPGMRGPYGDCWHQDTLVKLAVGVAATDRCS